MTATGLQLIYSCTGTAMIAMASLDFLHSSGQKQGDQMHIFFVSLHAKRLTLSLRLQGGTQRTAPLDFKSPVLHSMDEWLASLFPNVL